MLLASIKHLAKLLVGRRTLYASTRARLAHPDATEDSPTGQYVNTISKPYTVTTYARPNLMITHGKGSLLYDLEDRRYIDFMLGIAVTGLGHSNPEVTKIILEQAGTLMQCLNLYYNMPAGELANKLVTHTQALGGMKDAQRVFLCNSGTEANEAALKFARKYGTQQLPAKHEIITFANSFHGRTMGALSVTPNPKYQKPFAPLVPGVHVADTNNIDLVKQVILKDKTCAVIIEPIQGEGGVTPIAEDFLVELRKLCDENDVILIYDEIQCGLGRLGKLWAHCHTPDAHPDILTMAKALGNGFPIGAVMVLEKVEKALNVGDHGTTYGGNPLAAKVGCYVIDQVSNPEFLEQVVYKGDKFARGLEVIAKKHPEAIIGVKGRGLLTGLQFNDLVDVSQIVDKCRDHGLLLISAGMNVVRIVPALNIPNDLIDDGLAILEKVVDEVVA